MKKPLWRRVKWRDLASCENFLRGCEKYCVSACSRFCSRARGDRFWAFSGGGGESRALLFCHHRILFPVFAAPLSRDIPAPDFLGRFILLNPLHAIQGLPSVTEIFEEALNGLGYEKTDQFDYDLMGLDREPDPESLRAGPAGLALVKPGMGDLEEMLPLQADYDREEVLPRGSEFKAENSRLGLSGIIGREQVLAAKIGGKIVGKINTNAESFTRFQIGGVYVRPGYRGLGIARRMTAALSSSLLAQGKAVTLFVKKNNPAARSVYRKVGFESICDYRICYY
ncbi:MAG: GNAT family N-acetyltransferase [Spirochaetaceae bacterium]|jgi:ribosomal protein S18 acetylase RimI-like enzyme|nr:GNAT family N-acetyltransferase [Spirochaetaceae bacterium]